MEQAVTEMTKSWRAKGETHGIPHRSDHHGDTEGLQTYAMLISLQRTSSCIVD
jgi:hypothetical protein